jgi:hypothetical protein
MYSTIAHTSPPIPNVVPSYGVPNDVFTDLHRMQNPNQPPVNNLRTVAMQSQLAARNELAQFKEEISNMMKNKLGVDMGNTRLYQKPYRADFDYVAFPPGCVYLILLNLVVMTTVQPGNTLVNILLN